MNQAGWHEIRTVAIPYIADDWRELENNYMFVHYIIFFEGRTLILNLINSFSWSQELMFA